MKTGTAIVALTAIFIGSASYAQVLPGDGVVLTAYSVEAEVADAATGAVCDLSDAVINTQQDMSFKYYGDTLVCRKYGMSVDCFEIKGDTIWDLGANTREEMKRFQENVLT